MKAKNLLSNAFLFLFLVQSISYGQVKNQEPYTFLLTGASFATDNNGWFELGSESLGAKAINRAKGGTSIAEAANEMAEGSLYSKNELEEIDALVIMHVVDRDVYDTIDLKDDYKDYKTPFDRSNLAAAYDYVIKRYLTECYNLKDNKGSKYYGTPTGKPAVIVLSTDWHEGRDKYNTSIRKLADKWGFPLIEFDKNIGFSQKVPHPVTQKDISLIYSFDTQKIKGETIGWHPLRGSDKYIQQRMAAIFSNKMRTVFMIR